MSLQVTYRVAARRADIANAFDYHPMIGHIRWRRMKHRNVHIIVLAEPGGGKSTFTAQFCRYFDPDFYSRIEINGHRYPTHTQNEASGIIIGIREGWLHAGCFVRVDESSQAAQGRNTIEGRELAKVMNQFRIQEVSPMWLNPYSDDVKPYLYTHAKFLIDINDTILGPMASVWRKVKHKPSNPKPYHWAYTPPPVSFDRLTGEGWTLYEEEKKENIREVEEFALLAMADKAKRLGLPLSVPMQYVLERDGYLDMSGGDES